MKNKSKWYPVILIGLAALTGIFLVAEKKQSFAPLSTVTPASASNILPAAVSRLNCQTCHKDNYDKWSRGVHGHTQGDVAGELGEERIGQTAEEVIHGNDAEDCIACHGPTAVLSNGGMTEVQALNHFFTTTDGKFTKDTTTAHTADWPNITCTTCHNVPENHPVSMPALALFSSRTGKYISMNSPDELCGQCHGDLRFSGTDHLTYNAWKTSKHADTQGDIAGELSEERTGQTAEEVVHGDDAEDCIACHAPAAVLTNGGMSETQALNYFFTTTGGKFTKDTTVAHTSKWPNVTCISCHDPHSPGKPAYFNSSTGNYEPVKNDSELCGQCHGSLRFPDTDHLSYNLESGTGGIGIPDQQTMPGISCTDCHMYTSDEDGSNSSMYHGHTWSIFVKEAGGKSTVSCTKCHSNINAAKARETISTWKSEFLALDAKAQTSVAKAAEAMKAVNNVNLQNKLKEAQHNLTFAESDESSGTHNHKYKMALVKDANSKALEIIYALK
ncbi:MAG: ammonia-forming cytochrome c nitrite reductase subunit c552 [Spirochaetes bacterium]|nr:ammonia-forming cytochrome c nitrite reductase subunit c552 [Spirochaetota bacterium]